MVGRWPRVTAMSATPTYRYAAQYSPPNADSKGHISSARRFARRLHLFGVEPTTVAVATSQPIVVRLHAAGHALCRRRAGLVVPCTGTGMGAARRSVESTQTVPCRAVVRT